LSGLNNNIDFMKKITAPHSIAIGNRLLDPQLNSTHYLAYLLRTARQNEFLSEWKLFPETCDDLLDDFVFRASTFSVRRQEVHPLRKIELQLRKMIVKTVVYVFTNA